MRKLSWIGFTNRYSMKLEKYCIQFWIIFYLSKWILNLGKFLIFYSNPYFFSLTDNQHPNKYSTPYHYTEDPEPKNVLDFAYDTALDVGKFEHDTWKDILSKLPSENELRWAYNQSKTENSGPSMFLPKNFKYQIYSLELPKNTVDSLLYFLRHWLMNS